MGSNWETINLGEIIEIKYGKDHKKLNEGIIPCYGSGGIMRYVSEYLYDQESILIPRKGSLNNIYYIDEPFWTVDTLFWSKVDKNIADTKFIFYQLKLVDFKGLNEGTAVPSMTVPILNNIKIKLPPMKIQKEISKVLSTLDKKIELNQQTNQTLEQMAQTLFKSWFVDFDPVFDNLLAKVDFKLENLASDLPEPLLKRAKTRLLALDDKAKSTLTLALTPDLKNDEQSADSQAPLLKKTAKEIAEQAQANIHKYFPSEFEHNEQLGWIPKGWEEVTLESLVTLIGGGTPKTSVEEYWNGDIPWFSVVDAPNDSNVFVIDTEKHITQLGVEKSSTKMLRIGTTIISARGTVGKCAFVGTPMAMNQSCYGINSKEGISDEFVYYLTRHQVSDLQKRGHGSVFNTITRDTFKSILLPFSGLKLTNEFSCIVSALFDKILINNKQNIKLIELRDTLLPKLISGELQIPDIKATGEKIAEAMTKELS